MTARRARLRVCAVLPKGFVGGAEAWLLSLLDATQRLDVSAVLLEAGPLRGELERRGVPVRVLPVGPRPADLARAAPEVHRVLRRLDPDVVLANGVKAQAAVAVPASVQGVPVVWVKHDYSHDRALARPLGRLATRVVTTGDGVADATGRDDVVLVPPPRPPDPLPRAAAQAELRRRGVPADGAPVLAMLTRLIPYKGVDVAVRALAQPGAAGWRLVVMGSEDPAAPGEARRLRAVARGCGVAGRVHLLGQVPAAGRLLRAVDAVAVLTHPDGRGPGREGAGMAALEAMVAGTPFLALDDGGPVARRAAGGCGVLVGRAEPAAVAAALAGLDAAARERLGARGSALVADHPRAGSCADDLAAVLAEAAGLPGAGTAGGPPLSVVTTVLDEAASVDALLDALLPQLRDDDEVVVVDGGSRDATPSLVRARGRADPRVRLVEDPGAGISRGRNTGVRAARHGTVACTDAGCHPDAGWLDAFRAAAAERRPADLMTGTYRAAHRPGSAVEAAWTAVGYPDPDEARRAGPLVRAYGRAFGRLYDATLPTGRSMAFRRSAWAAAGGFPEHLQTAEDVLFGRAVVAAGGRAVLVRRALVTWQQRESLAATLRMYRSYGRGGGLAGSPLLVGRDAARALAYVAGPLALARGGPAVRTAVVAGAAAYASLPLVRVRRHRLGARAAALVPVVAGLRDLAKAVGCAQGLARRARSRARGADAR
ncbi:glycosyltransferase [Vallicoccus soli]|uniref:Glycosyltransferase n=1 Tax=Vallicoccus soli TaxID=2339232 RepID=A0A3A3Z0Y0_9ACTN|nr:glycosyltransferase [Vallicoccus soli]RJK97909.1 glycosyltransferase [Vallicoccus soli]